MRVSHCFGVCALVAALAGVSTTQAAPLGGNGADHATELKSALQTLIQYEDSHIVDNNPNFINPCWLIDRTFFESATSAQYSFSITVRWKATNGHFYRRHVRVAMADAIVVDPNDVRHAHETFDTSKWVRLRTVIDVSDHPVDPSFDIQGGMKLVRDAQHDHGDDCDHGHDHHGHGDDDADDDDDHDS